MNITRETKIVTDLKAFPVLGYRKYKNCPSKIRWCELNEEHAELIHSQSLKKLASRGGLCPEEIVMNVEKIPFKDFKFIDIKYALFVVRKLAL